MSVISRTPDCARLLGFGDDGFETARAELSAKLGNNAEAAGMIAALGDLDIRRGSGRGQDARRVIVVKIVGEIGDGAIPGIAGEAALPAAMIAFGPRGRRAAIQNVERTGRARRCRDSGSGQNLVQFARANDRVHFRNVLADLVVKTFHQAPGDDQSFCFAAGLVAGHFEDRVDRFLLGAGDKRAGVHDDDVGVLRVGSEFGPGLRQHAHHHLAIDEVLGAAEAHKAYLGRGS